MFKSLIAAINRLAEAQEEANEIMKARLYQSEESHRANTEHWQLQKEMFLYNKEQNEINNQQNQQAMEMQELVVRNTECIREDVEKSRIQLMLYVDERITEELGNKNEKVSN